MSPTMIMGESPVVFCDDKNHNKRLYHVEEAIHQVAMRNMTDNDETTKKPRRVQQPEEVSSLKPSVNPQQWLLQRRNDSNTMCTSAMVLSDHFGDASHMVESLTHQVEEWSLTHLNNHDFNHNHNHNHRGLETTKNKKRNTRAAKRSVMRALWHNSETSSSSAK
jgi:hypothetical protein